MNQRYRKEDGLDLAMFSLGPFIGKYGWVIADYSFKLMSWSLLVGTLEVFYEKTGLSVLWWTYNVGKGIFLIALLSLSHNLARSSEARVRAAFGIRADELSTRMIVGRILISIIVIIPVFLGILLLATTIVQSIWDALSVISG